MSNEPKLSVSKTPHLALSYSSFIETKIIENFYTSIDEDNLFCLVDKRDETAFAAIEWLMPSAIAVYLFKAYFDGFLNEMGSDHYKKLSKSLNNLWAETRFVKLLKVSTSENKISKKQPFSMVFSIHAEYSDYLSFKFMFPKKLSENELNISMKNILKLIHLCHMGRLNKHALNKLLQAKPVGGKVLLLTFDVYNDEFIIIDPLQEVRASEKISFRLD